MPSPQPEDKADSGCFITPTSCPVSTSQRVWGGRNVEWGSTMGEGCQRSSFLFSRKFMHFHWESPAPMLDPVVHSFMISGGCHPGLLLYLFTFFFFLHDAHEIVVSCCRESWLLLGLLRACVLLPRRWLRCSCCDTSAALICTAPCFKSGK